MGLRFAARCWRTSPALFTLTVLSIAASVCVNVSVFAVFELLYLGTLPVREPSQLAFLYSEGHMGGQLSADEGGGASFSLPLYRELRGAQTPFVDLAASRNVQVSLAIDDRVEVGQARMVSGNYFPLLGVRPEIGRLLVESDDLTPGGHQVVVLSHLYWVARFGGDASVLGGTLLVNGHPLTVVGVAPKGFHSERVGAPPEVYVPILMREVLDPSWEGLNDRLNAWVTLMGRRKPGVSLAQAEQELNEAYRHQLEKDLDLMGAVAPGLIAEFRARRMTLVSGLHGRGGLREKVRRPGGLLMAMALLLLLMASLNIASLRLARELRQTRDLAVRLALGASRSRLIREQVGEAMVLGTVGAGIGVLAALGATDFLAVALAKLPAAAGLDELMSSPPGMTVPLFAAVVTLASVFVSSLPAALRLSLLDAGASLADRIGPHGPSGWRSMRDALVAAQVAATVLFAVCASLLLGTVWNLTTVKLGFPHEGLLTFSALPRLGGLSEESLRTLPDRLGRELNDLPGVVSAAASALPAVAGGVMTASVKVDATARRDGTTSVNAVGPGYFRTMGIPLLAGRAIQESDVQEGPQVAVVNEAFATAFFDRRIPIGQRIELFGTREVVGVAKDVVYSSVREPPSPVVFLSMPQFISFGMLNLYVRSASTVESIKPSVRRAVSAVAPTLPIGTLKSLEQQLAENSQTERLLSVAATGFASLTALLAGVGLFGAMSEAVAARAREIAIRRAVGATWRDLIPLVLRETSGILLLGTGVGLLAATALGHYLRSLLFGLGPLDLPAYAVVGAFIALVYCLAAALPIKRALEQNPAILLRYQ